MTFCLGFASFQEPTLAYRIHFACLGPVVSRRGRSSSTYVLSGEILKIWDWDWDFFPQISLGGDVY